MIHLFFARISRTKMVLVKDPGVEPPKINYTKLTFFGKYTYIYIVHGAKSGCDHFAGFYRVSFLCWNKYHLVCHYRGWTLNNEQQQWVCVRWWWICNKVVIFVNASLATGTMNLLLPHAKNTMNVISKIASKSFLVWNGHYFRCECVEGIFQCYRFSC